MPCLKQSDSWQQSNGPGNKLSGVIIIKNNLSVLWGHIAVTSSIQLSQSDLSKRPRLLITWPRRVQRSAGSNSYQRAAGTIKPLFLTWTLWPLINPVSVQHWELSPAATQEQKAFTASGGCVCVRARDRETLQVWCKQRSIEWMVS